MSRYGVWNVTFGVGLGLGLVTWLAVPGVARGDTAQTYTTRLDDRSTAVHALPRRSTSVRMEAERVVMVPFLDRKTMLPRMLVHVWYDFSHAGKVRTLSVGFPEQKARYEMEEHWSGGAGGGAPNYTTVWKTLALPTIGRFSARVGARWLTVREHPGVGRYRRWFAYGLPLPAAKRVRLHNLYVAHVGRGLNGKNISSRFPEHLFVNYWFKYVLHTGATWAGTIGKGEVQIFMQGHLHLVRRFTNLEPTPTDDVHLVLPLSHQSTKPDYQEGLMGKQQLDQLRLVQESSHRKGAHVDSLGALAVDGDPATRWFSAATKALGAWVQLPANEFSALEGLDVVSGAAAGTPGHTLPRKITVLCVLRGRMVHLGKATLPNTAGPHRVVFAKPRLCLAVRLRVDDVHGNRALPVGVAEIRQRYNKDESVPSKPFTVKKPAPTLGKLTFRAAGAFSKIKLPSGKAGADTWEVAVPSDVRWSADGSLVYYRLWLENTHRDRRGVIMGYFVEVASGKVLRAVRFDKTGRLAEPYRSAWAAALTIDEAEAFMKQHGFVAAVRTRWPPRKSAVKGLTLSLKPDMQRTQGLLRIRARPTEFRWTYWANKATRPAGAGATQGSLSLVARIRGRAPKTLLRHTPRLDQAFAVRHAKVRTRRRPIFAKAAYNFSYSRAGYVQPSAKNPEQTWFALTYKTIHAFTGSVRIYWHPRAESALVVRMDRQELSSTTPDPKPDDVEPQCAQLPQSVCTWERLDYGRQRLLATVHSFVPKQPTTLKLPSAPPKPKPTPKSVGAADMSKPATGSTAMVAKSSSRDKAAPTKSKQRQGCTCRSATGTPVSPPIFTVVLWLLFRRRQT